METRPEQLMGVVLCRAGGQRIAFAASKISGIEVWRAAIPHAARAFCREVGSSGKALLGAEGAAVGVDWLDILSEPVSVLPAGALVGRIAGGSLLGFAQVRNELWPLLALEPFAQFLRGPA